MRVRRAEERDREFISEMARLASGLGDRPLPSAVDPGVVALLPAPTDLAVVVTDDGEHPLGAAWWHFHEPPLVLDDHGEALPEITMAVREDARGQGIGGRLLDELTVKGAGALRCAGAERASPQPGSSALYAQRFQGGWERARLVRSGHGPLARRGWLMLT